MYLWPSFRFVFKAKKRVSSAKHNDLLSVKIQSIPASLLPTLLAFSILTMDIRAEAAKQAASGGYTFVLDSSGMTTSGIPAVIYAPPAADLTVRILKALNATAVPAEKTEKK